jgi:TRAP-type C4-dicarboxylate transport system substrate-binding protein
MTGHVWDGYWILGNRRAWAALPEDLRKIATAEFDKSALQERADIATLSDTLRQNLTAKGLTFNDVDRKAFRAALGKTSFYKDWKAKFGDEAWSLLEASTGPLT